MGEIIVCLYSKSLYSTALRVKKKRPGWVLLELLVCTALAMSVGLGVLELTGLAIKNTGILRDRHLGAVAFSSVVSEINSGLISGDLHDYKGWSGCVRLETNSSPLTSSHVSISGSLGSKKYDLTWRVWGIQGRP